MWVPERPLAISKLLKNDMIIRIIGLRAFRFANSNIGIYMNIIWFIIGSFAASNRNLCFGCAVFLLVAYILNRWVIHWQ